MIDEHKTQSYTRNLAKIWKNNGLGSSMVCIGEDLVVGIDDSGEPKKRYNIIFCVHKK